MRATLTLNGLNKKSHPTKKSLKPGLNSIILIPVKMINLLLKIYLTLIRLGFLRVVFPGGGEGQFDPLPLPAPFIFQEELIYYQTLYNY